MTIWKFVTFSDVTGDSIDIITFNCSTEKKMFTYIKRMGFTLSEVDQPFLESKPTYIFMNKRGLRADLERYESYEDLF